MRLLCLKTFLVLLIAFSLQSVSAQAPDGINYQAALRDSDSGEALSNEMVFMVITVRDGGPSGTVVYSETHSGIQTNDYGLINLVIGGGDATEGSFDAIPWSSANIWYEIEVDRGSGLQSLGASQFLSVPYALFAGNVEESLDNDPTNELINSAELDAETQSIVIQEAGNQFVVDLEGLEVNDADADPTNELISSATYNADNNSIDIVQGDGSVLQISLANLSVTDADSDPENELIVSATYNQETNSIDVVQADGSTVEISLTDLSTADADADPENELIDPDQGLQLIGTNLVISEAGIAYSVNLDALAEDGDWAIDEDANTVYNENQKIGIGTVSPTARLEVVEESNSDVALNVVSGDESILHVSDKRLGIKSTSPVSTVQFGGSVGYDVTLLGSDETDDYTASIEDHMIVINFQSLSNTDFGIFLPPADVCAGRVYVIRKTGAAAAAGQVLIDTGGFPVDFFTPNLVLNDFGAETAVLLSLGDDGWTRILREN